MIMVRSQSFVNLESQRLCLRKVPIPINFFQYSCACVVLERIEYDNGCHICFFIFVMVGAFLVFDYGLKSRSNPRSTSCSSFE